MSAAFAQAPAPLLAVHGLYGSLDLPEFWSAFTAQRVLAPARVGYGQHTTPSAADFHMEAQADSLMELAQKAFGSEPIDVVGHSVGGVIAMVIAARHPQRVRHIVSVEGNFSLKDAFWSSRLAKMPAAEAEEQLAEYRQDPAKWIASSVHPVSPWQARIANDWLHAQPATTLQSTAKAVVDYTANNAYAELLKRVFSSHPVHLISGERSRAGWDVPDWALAKAKSYIELPSRGHLPMLEDPLEFSQTLRRLLESK